MNSLWIGSANQYTKLLSRQTQWSIKKQSGNVNGHSRSLGDYVSTQSSIFHRSPEEEDTRLSGIMAKATTGKKLSPADWDYLKAKNPMLYEKLRQAEQEQKDYEEALRRCKTKDEAQRLHLSKLGEIMSAAKNGDEGALIRLNRMTESMNRFAASKEYQELPTEGEEAVEREQERQARVERLRQELAAAQAEREDTSPEETEKRTEAKAEAEDGPETAETSPKRTEPEHIPGIHAHAAESPDSYGTAQTRRSSVSQEKEAPAGREASGRQTVGATFGRRAYLDQRDTASKKAVRRKKIEAEA